MKIVKVLVENLKSIPCKFSISPLIIICTPVSRKKIFKLFIKVLLGNGILGLASQLQAQINNQLASVQWVRELTLFSVC